MNGQHDTHAAAASQPGDDFLLGDVSRFDSTHRLRPNSLRRKVMSNTRETGVVSVGFWVFALIVMAIPLVNIVMMFVWAFAGENQSRKNYFRATLILLALMIALVVVLAAVGMLPALLEQGTV